MTDERMELLNNLVNEVTKDDQDLESIKKLATQLGIPFSEDPMQLLNNVLKGIHSEGPKNESNI
ncbi:MAG: hypothetical protein KDD38_10070 [Bdellovibrionales bacterium]|nr:hypothetical protein [Bdellovibrionales bacterium]